MPEIHINPDQNLTGHIEASELQNLTGKIGVGYVYPTLETLEVTPTTERQLIYPEKYGFSEVEVDAVDNTIDGDIKAENIKKDVEILGVVGTYDGLVGQEKIATPTTSEQVITPDEGYTGLTKVTINPVTNEIDEDIVANNIKKGVNILGVDGNVEEVNAQTKSVTPSTSQQTITPDAEYNALSEVVVGAVDSSIDNNIQSSNIKAGVSILDVEGSVVEKVGQTKTAKSSTSQQTITPDTGYNALDQVTIEAIDTETKNVKSKTTQQIIYPTENKVIDEIVVEPIRRLRIEDSIYSNGQKQYTTPQGYDGLSGVYLNIEVDPYLQYKEVEITENGTITISADEPYDGLNEVEITTNVSGTEDLNTELTAQDTALASQELKIQQMIQALEDKKALDLQEATSDATATASDIVEGKTAYANGIKVIGTMSTDFINVYVQNDEPNVYEGLWIKSSDYTYSQIKEISDADNVEASTINILNGTTYTTKLAKGQFTYNFDNVFITDANNNVVYGTEVYYGNGSAWVDITNKIAGISVDFANGTITDVAGSSNVNSLNCYSGRRRCNVNNSGQVTAYYGTTNYNNVGSSTSQVMVEQPQVYYSLQNVVVSNGAIEKADYIVADKKLPLFELHPAFKKGSNTYEKVYVGAYEGTLVNNRLSSIGGGTSVPTGGYTRSQFRTYAFNRGSRFSQMTKQYEDLESLLMTIEFKSFNHQQAFSVGVTGNSSAVAVGQTYTLDANGTGLQGADASTSACFTWRWRENKYGNVFKWNDGINRYDNTWYIKDNGFSDDTSSGYTQLTETAVAESGWITRFAYVPNAKWIFMPKVVSGDYTEGLIGDYYHYSTGWNVYQSSCDWGYNVFGGSFTSFSSSSAYAYTAISTTLLCY